VHTSATKRSTNFIGKHMKPVVLVLDNSPIHTSKASKAALAARS
jgi:hypothetical protein